MIPKVRMHNGPNQEMYGMENCTGVINRNPWGDFLNPPDTQDEQHLDQNNKNEPSFPAGPASKTQDYSDF